MTETITSSYEAAYLQTQGHTCRIVPRATGRRDCNFIFDKAGQQLSRDRQQYLDDIDVQEFISSHRRLKYAISEVMKRPDKP